MARISTTILLLLVCFKILPTTLQNWPWRIKHLILWGYGRFFLKESRNSEVISEMNSGKLTFSPWKTFWWLMVHSYLARYGLPSWEAVFCRCSAFLWICSFSKEEAMSLSRLMRRDCQLQASHNQVDRRRTMARRRRRWTLTMKLSWRLFRRTMTNSGKKLVYCFSRPCWELSRNIFNLNRNSKKSLLNIL